MISPPPRQEALQASAWSARYCALRPSHNISFRPHQNHSCTRRPRFLPQRTRTPTSSPPASHTPHPHATAPLRQNDHLQGASPSRLRPAHHYPAFCVERFHCANLSRDQPPVRVPALTWPPQDILTGDEIISDSYNLKEIDGVVYEADCTRIKVGGESFGRCPPRLAIMPYTNTVQTLVPTRPPRRLKKVPRTASSRRSMLSTPSASTRPTSTRRAT